MTEFQRIIVTEPDAIDYASAVYLRHYWNLVFGDDLQITVASEPLEYEDHIVYLGRKAVTRS